jgi:glyoxylase-like metal-dependent hydrolase (beta-lactamase superfamily II)
MPIMNRLLTGAFLAFVLTGCGSSTTNVADASCSGAKCDQLADADAPTADAEPASPCDGAGPGEFPQAWINGGVACGSEPSIQVHQFNDDTFILRQSLCTSFEAPFLYLLFGEDKVLLEDTGAGGVPVQQTVQAIIDQWLIDNRKLGVELVVVNSHAHSDHAAGNSSFLGQPNTTVVGFSVQELMSFFAIQNWPEDAAEIDLGNRVIDVLPIPGHEASHIALFDRRDGLLLTGDSLYPGRLIINDFPTYQTSIERLVSFTSTRDTCHVLGTHVEMTNAAGDELSPGSTFHPDEHPLQLGVEHLIELRDALLGMEQAPTREVHDEFVIVPL